MSKIALTPNASGDGVFTITAPNSGTDRAIALPDAAGTIPLLAAASNTAITSTPAELNILDGVTSTAAELNILDGVTSTTAELNILDGVTATAAEINLIDGGTARGTTAVADGDGFLTNDGGTMRMTTVDTLATYMGTKVGGGSMVFIASSGALSNAATVVFTGFDASAYDSYVFMMHAVVPVQNNMQLYCQVSADGGSSYATTNGNYHTGNETDSPALSVSRLDAGDVNNSQYNFGVTGPFELFNLTSALFTTSLSKVMVVESGGTQGGASMNFVYGHRNSISQRYAAEVTDAVRFLFEANPIESGEIVMYGIANA